MDFHVPTIDISPYVTGGAQTYRSRAAAALDRALAEFTVVHVIGHGIPKSVFEGLTIAVDELFALDVETKETLRRTVDLNRGYSAPKDEIISMSLGLEPESGEGDYFESWNVGTSAPDYPHTRVTGKPYAENAWPSIPNFQRRIDTYFNEAGRVSRELMGVFGDALRLTRDFFPRLTDHSIDTMRLINYAHGPGVTPVMRGMSEHTDFGLLTLQWADALPGLQVAVDGEWHEVITPPGALTIMVGDLLARLTNDRWPATLHRTMQPIVDGAIETRRAVVYYHDGNAEAEIAPIRSLVPAGTTPAYPPIVIENHITAKLAGSRGGVPYADAAQVIARLPRE